MIKSNFLSFFLGILAVAGISVFALSSGYLKSDGTPDFQKLKSTANGNQLNAQMRDQLMDGLSKMQEQQNVGAEIPAGAVMAFDATSCPTGWSRFAEADGRFIMGSEHPGNDSYTRLGFCKAGDTMVHRNGQRVFCSGTQTGGNSSINLTIEQLPSHQFYLFADDKTRDRSYDKTGTDQHHKNGSIAWENDHDDGNDNFSYTMATSSDGRTPTVGRTNALGNNHPINIQNPYIKLLYCKKN